MTKILAIEEKKDKNGAPMKVCQLEENKTVYVNSRYDSDIYPLVEINKEVEVVQVDTFWKIMPESFGLKPKSDWKGGKIEKAMERKEHSIGNFQKQKEENIKMISASRDATLIMVEMIKKGHDTEDVIKEEWKRWREWFYSQYNAPFV